MVPVSQYDAIQSNIKYHISQEAVEGFRITLNRINAKVTGAFYRV